jgi:hypothetical protein
MWICVKESLVVLLAGQVAFMAEIHEPALVNPEAQVHCFLMATLMNRVTPVFLLPSSLRSESVFFESPGEHPGKTGMVYFLPLRLHPQILRVSVLPCTFPRPPQQG